MSLAQDHRQRGAWYFSRPVIAVAKGRSSGHVQRVVECGSIAIRTGLDQVEQTGAACHTGRRSCFYRAVTAARAARNMSFVDAERLFDRRMFIGNDFVIPERRKRRPGMAMADPLNRH